MTKTQFVRDLQDKASVSSPFLVKYSALSNGKNGKPYLNVVLMDKTGEVEARIWDDVANLAPAAVRDNYVLVEGRCQLYQGRKQIVIARLRMLREDEVDPAEFIPKSALDPEDLYARLLAQVASMQDPFYKALAESIFKDDREIAELVRIAPAAKSMHHAYRTGLLEHVVSIVDVLDMLAKHYGKYLDRDLLFLGGFLHDVGKIWELSYDRATEYTTEGKLIGHLVMGVELVERKVRELEAQPGRLPGAFPEEKKLLVKHLILAHHGQLDYGSPKRPKCLEALVVHAIDDLDSKINAIRVFTQMDISEGRWTAFNRQFERFFFKPDWAMEAARDADV